MRTVRRVQVRRMTFRILLEKVPLHHMRWRPGLLHAPLPALCCDALRCVPPPARRQSHKPGSGLNGPAAFKAGPREGGGGGLGEAV